MSTFEEVTEDSEVSIGANDAVNMLKQHNLGREKASDETCCCCPNCNEKIKQLQLYIESLESKIQQLTEKKSTRKKTKPTSNISKRERIITEIHTTEINYQKFLKTLLESFRAPLVKQAVTESPIIPVEDINTIFQNSLAIFRISEALVSKITTRLTEKSFSFENSEFTDIFVDLFEDKSLQLQVEYQKYVNSYEKSIECVSKCLKNQKFQKFVEDAFHKIDSSFVCITSFLIAPVQRLPRYILMLKDLEKHTEETHVDKQNSVKALLKIQEITERVNTGKQFYERILRKEEVLNRFSDSDRYEILKFVNPEEIILVDSTMLEMKHDKRRPRHIIITTNNLVVAKKKSRAHNHELALCYVISFVSCDIQIKNDTQCIELHSLDRIDQAPFISKSVYCFTVDEDTTWNFWEKCFSDVKNQVIDPTALLFRSTLTKRHLQQVLLTPYHLAVIAIGAEKLDYRRAGTVLVKEGQIMENIYYIHKGSVDVVKHVDQEPTVIASMFEGDIIGDISFLKNLKRRKPASSTATIIAGKHTSITKLSRKNLFRTFQENEEFEWRFYFLLAAITAERIIRINDLMYRMKASADSGVEVKKYIPPSNSSENSPLKDSGSRLRSSRSRSLKLKSLEKSTTTFTSIAVLLGEPILQSFSCKFIVLTDKKPSPVQGMLLLARSNVVIYRKVFGKKTQIVIPSASIKSVVPQADPKNIKIQYFVKIGDEEIEVIVSEDDAHNVISLLKNYVQTSEETVDVKKLPKGSFHTNELDLFKEEIEFKKGAVILEPGKLSSTIFQLISGSCRVEITTNNGERVVVGTIKSGEIFGELSFLLGTVTSAYVVANSKVSVVQCSWDNLATIISRKPSAAVAFYRNIALVLCKRSLRAERKAMNLTHEEKSVPVVRFKTG